MLNASPEIQLVVFDLAGTTLDFGCMAPVASFIEAFAQVGVTVSVAEARAPMGLNKKDHVRAMLKSPPLTDRWRLAHQRDWNEDDVENVYQRFMPLQLEVVDRHATLIPGLLTCIAELRTLGIKIGTTTGYFSEAAQRVHLLANQQGFKPDVSLCAEDASEGRPAPYMIFRIMEKLRIQSVKAVLKVGDTVHDIQEGLNAGAWTAGVIHSSSEVGCTEADLAALPSAERERLFEAARKKLQNSGAHALLDTIADVPKLVTSIRSRLLSRNLV